MTLGLGIALIACCLLAQGFFSGSEMALVSADRTRLQARADDGDSGAALALTLLQQEERLLGTCLIGTNIALVTGSTITIHLLLAHHAPEEWIATLLFVPLALTFGEALPKTVYAHHADALAPVLARPLRVLQWAFTPLLVVVSTWSRLLKRGSAERPIRREDIVELLDEKTGTIDAEDRRLIQRVFAMTELTVERCMTPLVDVYALAENATVAEAIDVVLSRGHSRLPVYRDRVDNIVGVVNHRDLLYGPEDHESIAGIVQPVRFVPDSKRADELLREMRRDNDHFAVVVDEYGGSVGLVTIEDMLEEIIGDIADERDKAVPAIRRLGEREWRVPARAEIEELEDAIGRKLPDGDYETVAGLILAATGRIPEAGEVIRVGRFTFHIEVASERAIRTVRLTL